MNPTSIHSSNLYLSCIGTVFAIAFLSYHSQFPGLLSSSGLEPVHRVYSRAFPMVHKRLEDYIDVDALCELTSFVGFIFSCIVASGLVQHGLLIGTMTLLYYFLVDLGGTFYSFQWDSLLLETGFLTAICYAPWLPCPTAIKTIQTTNSQDTPQKISLGLRAWPIRFLLFKLMFMSGVVKLQSNCPTWINLTALEYHFASQCLPGPLAWHAHQMPPFLLRLSVAVTLLTEIPASFLLLAPWSRVRQWGAVLQMTLQIAIILTGNYNFFNILTMTLCLTAMEEDHKHTLDTAKNVASKSRDGAACKRWQVKKLIKQLACISFLVWSFGQMFELDHVGRQLETALAAQQQQLRVTLKLTSKDCNRLIEAILPIVIPVVFSFVAFSGFSALQMNKNSKYRLVRIAFHLMVCILCIGVTAIPLTFLTPTLSQRGFIGSNTIFSKLWTCVRPYRFSNGYGLFRQMTGVGNRPIGHAREGWAGQPPSIVARPEIVLEGLFVDFSDSSIISSASWRELKFRWKPGDVKKVPKQVAPHQPRLDWQMWFAALGSYQNNPWLVHLVDKILQGCRPVLALLDEPKLTSGEERVMKIRARIFSYDFTRVDSEWNRGITTTLLPLTAMFGGNDPYWTRQPMGDYLPTIEANNTSVNNFLAAYGYEKLCDEPSDRCNRFKTRTTHRFFCYISSFLRKSGTWCCSICAVLCLTWFTRSFKTKTSQFALANLEAKAVDDKKHN